MFRFFQHMIALRKEFRILRTNISDGTCGLPDVSFHSVDPWQPHFEDHEHYVGVLFCGEEPGGKYEAVYVASNAYWEPLKVRLPALPPFLQWEVAVDTWEAEQVRRPHRYRDFMIQPRSVMVFVAVS